MTTGPSDSDSSQEPKRPPQFRLWQLMLVVTVAAVVLGILRLIPFSAAQEATEGIVGFLLFGGVLCLVAAPGYFLTYWVTKSRGWAFAAGIVSIIGFLWLLIPSVTTPRWAARRMQCENNLKQIGFALHAYHDNHKSLPPAFICDKSGKQMHSWRVLLLPYMEQQELYNKYDFSEPWDGPNNIKLAPAITAIYQCPEETHSGATGVSYVAVVGRKTMWPGGKGILFSDVKDGLSNTIMVVEVAGSSIQGSEPRDLNYDQLALQIISPAGGGISSLHGKTWHSDANCVQLLFGDGSVHVLSNDLKPATLKLLLEINDGQPIGDY
ncbi:MAG: DUF1559 domain-containing protein [Pirellulaceae bacterium]